MNARPIDAAEGYRLYRQHQGDIELGEVNEYLTGLGLREVSPRMYIHYRRLFSHGYESYIPINRFDVAVAGDLAWSEDVRARYPEIDEPFPGELTWRGETHDAMVESLGLATATLAVAAPPTAGTPVVLRLTATGISRIGSVVRSDPVSGRVHLAFDPYSSVPVASADSRYRATMRFPLGEDSQSVVVLADLLLNLDRILVRASRAEEPELARVSVLSLNSPLEVVLIGHGVLLAAIVVAQKVAKLRLTWYEGSKAKAEAEGVQLDNKEKRRVLELEVDEKIEKQVAAEEDSEEPELLQQLQTDQLPVGAPGSPERRKLIEVIRASLELPPDFEGEIEDTHDAG